MGAPGSPQTPFGTDLTILDENLRLSPDERWQRHVSALALVEEIRAAARAKRLHQDTRPAPR